MRKITSLFFTIFLVANCAASHSNVVPTRFIVMRHGEADHNVKHLFNSNPESSEYFVSHLTDEGKKQVGETAEKLLAEGFSTQAVDIGFVSPLPRTMETAGILVARGVVEKERVKTESRLIEANSGTLESKSVHSVADAWDLSEMRRFGGEDDDDLKKRLCSLVSELVNQHSNQTILLVTHGSPARILQGILNQPERRLKTAEAFSAIYDGHLVGCDAQ